MEVTWRHSPWNADFPPIGSAYGDYLYVSANDLAGDPCAYYDGGGTIIRIPVTGGWTNFTAIGKNAGGPTQPLGIAFPYGTPFGDKLLIANSIISPASICQADTNGAFYSYFDPAIVYGAFSPLTLGKGPWQDLLIFRDRNSKLQGLSPSLTVTYLLDLSIYSSHAIRMSASSTFGTNIYFSTSNAGNRGTIMRLRPDGQVETFADGFGYFYAGWYGITMMDNLEFTPDGNTLFVSDWQRNKIYRITPKFTPANLFLSLNGVPSSAPAGSVISLSGLAGYTGGTLGRGTIVNVMINSTPVEALDPAGDFFSTITIQPGRNNLAIVAEDSLGVTVSNLISITGTQPNSATDFSNLGVVSASVQGQYGRTTFNEKTKTLYADVALHNIGSYAVRAPFFVGVARISDPTVSLLAADGVTPDGISYYDFTGTLTNGVLNPQQTTLSRTLAFHNPNKVQFTYDLVVLGQLNQAPYFTTAPPLEVIANHTYAYAANAIDPDADTLNYSLLESPVGMTINPGSGAISWNATNGIGNYNVRLSANDSRGGTAEQDFLLNVISAPSN